MGISVPKFLDLGGKRHPKKNNFPLSLLIFKSEISTPSNFMTSVFASQFPKYDDITEPAVVTKAIAKIC